MMDGTITVKSEFGQGAVFTAEIPAVKGSAEGVNNKENTHKEQALSAPSAKILLVDDNEFNLRAAETLLSLVDIKAKTVFCGQEAIDLVKKESFDIIFMDHMMPEMNGIEVVAHIRAWEKETNKKHLVIIALTATAVQGAKEMFLSSGFTGFIAKPIEMRELKKALVEWLPREKIEVKERTPSEKADEIETNLELQRSLQLLFAKSNQKKYEEISKALETDDIKLAHRLAHTLKSNAGHLNKVLLQQIAGDIEQHLKDGKNLTTHKQMAALETELNVVLAEFAPLLNKTPISTVQSEFLDTQSALEIIKKLEPLLEMGSSECMGYIDRLRLIPYSEELIIQIEDFDFETAIATLAELKKRLAEA